MDVGKIQLAVLIYWSLVLTLVVGLLLTLVIGFDPLHGDPGGYIADSLEWDHPFDPYHVPGFALGIALLRVLSFGMVEDYVLMLVLTSLSFIICLTGCFLLVGGRDRGLLAAGLFALWPWVGVVYVIYPIADLLAIGLFLWGWVFLRRERLWMSGLLLGLAMVVHKVMWIFVPGLLVGVFLSRENWKAGVVGLLSSIPVIALWIAGIFYHSDPQWLLSSNLELEVQSPSYLPVLDGLLGPLLFGDFAGKVRGLTVLGIFLLGLAVLFWSLRRRDHYMLGISASVLFLCLTVDEGVVWSVVRFGRILVIPAVLFWGSGIIGLLLEGPIQKLAGITVGVVLVLTQFAFAYHMALGQRIG